MDKNKHSPLTERYSFRLSDKHERSPYPGLGAAEDNIYS